MVPLDGEFNVDLLARYFAGGLAADRPVKWRAAQFPYVFTPPGREGFLFSTDARFSGDAKFKSTAVLERDQRTDAGGAARMSFDTTIEPTAQPRRYSIEATVTGDDDIEVRNVQNVIAVPPFVLGVKTPRYVARPGAITPELIAINGKGEAVEGLEMTLRFIKRNWISTLQASDFAQGAAKYVTQVHDETLLERKVASAKEAQKIELEAKDAGVYLVQLEAYDRIGRRQQVSVDFFVGGDTPVTFQRPPSSTATVTLDKEKYAPGETATLLVQSPFQNARALVIVEQPSGVYDYQFIDIANGFGRYALTLKKEQTPKLAVHFLIMRGRLKDSAPTAASSIDQGKPITIAATKWIEVTPVKNIVTVKLEAPGKARPGQEVEVSLRLADDAGKPLAGEATFWMVDQAVLSLAKEQPLDPLANFIVARDTKMAARDTRNMAFGIIPLEEVPGGDGAALEEWGAENNISVRQEFHAGADLSAEREDRRRRDRQNQGEAAGHADRVQVARQGGQRRRPLRLRGRRNADPPGAGGAAGVAALRAARRLARSRARRARRGRTRRRRLRVDIGARSRYTGRGELKDRVDAKQARASRRARQRSRAKSRRAKRQARLQDRTRRRSRQRCGRNRPAAQTRPRSHAPIRGRRDRRRREQDAPHRQRRSSSRKFFAQDRAGRRPRRGEARRGTERSGRISVRLHGAASLAGALGSRAERLFACSRRGGVGGAHFRQCEDDRAGGRTIDRRRRTRPPSGRARPATSR